MPRLLHDLIERARGVPGRWRVPVHSGLRSVSFKHAFWSGLTGALGILAIHLVTTWSGQPLLIGSFGASAVLLFGVPDSALSQPRNLVGGHVLSALVAVATVALVGSGPLSIALGVGLSMFVMSLTRTLHPPGGATALIGVQGAVGLEFVAIPVLAGALILLAMALVTNNVVRHRRYPLHWL